METKVFSRFRRGMLANSALISLRYAIVSAVGLALSVAFAHLSTKEVFGQYQFILSIFAFFSVFSLPGLNLAALKSIVRGETGSVSQAVRLSFFGGVLAIPFLIGYGTYVLFSGSQNVFIGWSCIVFGFFFPLLNAPNTWYVYYEGHLRFFPVAIRVIGASLLSAVFLFAGLWNQLGVFALVSIWFLTNMISGWLFFWEVRKREHVSENSFGTLDISYGLRTSIQKFFVGLTENIPVVAISFFIGFEAVADFQVAFVFAGAISGLLGALTVMALPVIFSDIRGKHSGLFFYSIVSGILASVGYILFVQAIFVPVYGDRYQESLMLARILAFLPFLVSLRLYFVNIFTAREENVRIMLVYAIANVLSVLFFWIALRSGISFSPAMGIYLYSINLLLLLPLAFSYFSNASSKTDSI